YVKCDLCAADDYSSWGRKDGFRIVECNQCGLVYTNPRLDLERVKKLYTTEYFSQGDYAEDPLRKRMYIIEIETQIKKLIGNKGRFLDVGCALGAFLKLLPDSFEKYGTEISQQAADYAREKNGLNIEIAEGLATIKFPDNFFDIIHLRGVIEHLRSPTVDLKKAYSLLKPSGRLIVSTTPNIVSPAARFYREQFRLVFPKEHIYYFSPRTLSRLLQKTGFVTKAVFYPYINTPYASLFKDIKDFFFNRMRGKESPPFFYSVMTFYAQKT
ncbi:methyltransferase domain-containing protein, partial [Candidatus Omnitrophota bacterium]